MNIKINRKNLIDAAEVAAAFAGGDQTISHHAMIEAEKEGVTITATDLISGVRLPVESEVQEQGSVCLLAARLKDIAKAMASEDVIIETVNGRATVAGGETRYQLGTLAGTEFPHWSISEAMKIEALDSTVLSRMVSAAAYAVSRTKDNPTIEGLCMDIGHKSLAIAATDGHRLAAMRLPVPCGFRRKVAISRTALIHLPALMGDSPVDTQVSDNMVVFRKGDTEIMAKQLVGTFPAWEKVIPQDIEHKAVIDRIAFKAALSRVLVLSGQSNSSVILEFDKGGVRLFFNAEDVGEVEDRVEAEYDGPAQKVKFNGHYLVDALKAVKTKRVVFHIGLSRMPSMVTEHEGEAESWHVVMPMA